MLSRSDNKLIGLKKEKVKYRSFSSSNGKRDEMKIMNLIRNEMEPFYFITSPHSILQWLVHNNKSGSIPVTV